MHSPDLVLKIYSCCNKLYLALGIIILEQKIISPIIPITIDIIDEF